MSMDAPTRPTPAHTLDEAISCVSDYDPKALPVASANAIIGRLLSPVRETETLPVREALGRVLAQDVVSPINVPSHDNSAMDGWALRFADLVADRDTPLREVGTAFAGRAYDGPLKPGECVRVMTGAVMPGDTDTVVPQEFAHIAEGVVTIPMGQEQGQNRRFAGEDLAVGKPALAAGTWLKPAEIGMLASLGIAKVTVRRRLRVAFFSTGDELKSLDDHAGEPLGPGEVYDSNRYTLWGMLTRLGCEVVDLGVVRDDPVALEAAFREAASRADAVITSGGVSVGEADFTKQMMAKLGEVVFWTIAMRPGRPMAFGQIRNEDKQAFLFGLPGNPVAVMVTFYHFVRAALLTLSGRSDTQLPLMRVKSQVAMRKRPGRTEYQRGILELVGGEWTVKLTGAQGSGILRSMSMANCFVVLGHAQGNVAAGEAVDVMLFDGLV
jgi:molybdopterin molybdotransferase